MYLPNGNHVHRVLGAGSITEEEVGSMSTVPAGEQAALDGTVLSARSCSTNPSESVYILVS